MANLLALYMDGNQFKSLPEVTLGFKSLTNLNLKGIKLTNLAKEIAGFTKLKELTLLKSQYSEQEQIMIKKILPNCEVGFY